MDEWIENHDQVTLLACGKQHRYLYALNVMGQNAFAIDYDPQFDGVNYYDCSDFIFDSVKILGLAVHYNCEKTYPIGRKHIGDFILRGDNKRHSGDGNPITSCEQLIEQNKITEVYETKITESHFLVYGNNRSTHR